MPIPRTRRRRRRRKQSRPRHLRKKPSLRRSRSSPLRRSRPPSRLLLPRGARPQRQPPKKAHSLTWQRLKKKREEPRSPRCMEPCPAID